MAPKSCVRAICVLSVGAIVVGCATGGGDDDLDLLLPPLDSGASNDSTSQPPPGSDSSVQRDTAPPPVDSPTGTCGAGETLCSGTCTDTQTDPYNCGMCGNSCQGGSGCTNGMCAAPTCSSGETLCGSTCTNTQTDSNNCGTCNTVCANGSTCSSGMCTTSGGTCGAPTGTCSHSLCSAGGPLADGCDPNGCTFSMCDEDSSWDLDPYCCQVAWDSTCVGEVEMLISFGLFGCGS
jgi:hypothetical protein